VKKLLFVVLICVCGVISNTELTDADKINLEGLKHSYKQRKCVARTLYHEARGEPLEGIRAVFSVIVNRSRKSGKSFCEIVSAHKQFSYMNSGKISLENPLTEDEKKLYDAVTELDNELSEDVLFYHNTSVKPKWTKKMKVEKRIGNHIFYKLKEK